jgi:hypothetical protein
MKLNINETVSLGVDSREMWNDTGLFISAGEIYSFHAVGEWKDAWIVTNADGYVNAVLDPVIWLRRSRRHRWFALVGTLDRENDFLIGTSSIIAFENSGLLSCFANDLRFMYWNNHGSLNLEITRIK